MHDKDGGDDGQEGGGAEHNTFTIVLPFFGGSVGRGLSGTPICTS